MRTSHHSTIAILWVVSATAMFTVIFAAAKIADGTVGALQITFLRYVGSFATILGLAQSRGGLFRLRSSRPLVHFLRALTGSSAALAITQASAKMPIVDATAMGMLYGVLTVLLGLVFLREWINATHWLAISISLVGALIVVMSQGAFQSSALLGPMLLAIGAALLLAIEGLLIHVLSGTDRALAIMAYVNGFGVLLLAPFAFWQWQPITASVALTCLALGPFAIFAQYCTIRGYRLAPLSVVGPVDYAWLVFATILGVVFFGEIPTPAVILGSVFIIFGGWMLTQIRAEPPI